MKLSIISSLALSAIVATMGCAYGSPDDEGADSPSEEEDAETLGTAESALTTTRPAGFVVEKAPGPFRRLRGRRSQDWQGSVEVGPLPEGSSDRTGSAAGGATRSTP